MIRPTLRGLVFGLAVLALSSFVASAHPYASAITNTGGVISFTLNEAANGIGVYYPQNASTQSLTGPFPAGRYSFTPGAGTNAYVIYVTKAGSGVPNLISPAISVSPHLTDFNGPRGVAVNRNPQSHNFGRIYVVNASPGNDGQRAVGKGVYVVNADFSDCLGYGATASPPTNSFPATAYGGTESWYGPGPSAPLPGPESTTYAPYRCWVGPDDTVYVADSSYSSSYTFSCPVFMIDPDLTTPILMFPYSGVAGGNSGNAGPVQTTPFVTGSLGQGNMVLTCMMWSYLPSGSSYQSVLQYNVGSGPINSSTPWTAAPTIIVTNAQIGFGSGGVNEVAEDLVVNPTNNYVYVSFYRSNGGGFPAGNMQLAVYNGTAALPNGTNHLWGSTDYSGGGTDFFQTRSFYPYGMAISPDGQYLGFGNEAGTAEFGLIRLTNGIPDISSFAIYPASNVGQRSVAFDAADNFYTVEGSSDALKCYSLGFTTTCVTSNDLTTANGSFWMILPSTTASVATTANASQSGTAGVFQISSQGQSGTLNVTFSLTNNGTPSFNPYKIFGATVTSAGFTTNVTIAQGAGSTNITITPINDGVARLAAPTLVLTVNGGASYGVSGVPATMVITNTAEPQLVLSAAASTCYKRYTNDYTSATITRWGSTNSAISVSTLNCTGTAVQNTDYALYSAPTIAAGATATTWNVFRPLNPPEPSWVGNKGVLVTVGANGGTYNTYSSNNSLTLTILDDKYPAAPVLWSDPLNTPLGGVNGNDDGYGQWNLTEADRQDIGPDETIDWGYNLLTDPNGYGFIPLPPNGLTSVLRATCNKVHGGDDQGLNLYPTNVAFSGDYAVRFQMYMGQGGENGGVGAGTVTEGPMFGINHTGTNVNWWSGSSGLTGGPWASDGVWYWLSADPGGTSFGDYSELTGITNSLDPTLNTGWVKLGALFGSTSFPNVYKDPQIFTTVGASTNAISGIPANASWAVVPTNNANWADVEIKQIKNVVTLSINKTEIFSYANTNSLFQQGTIMLGYEDPYDSQGDPDAAVFYSNVQVVRLSTLNITSITTGGGNVTIQFTSPDGNVTLQSSATANGTYTDVSPAATFTQDPVSEVFQTVYPQNGAAQFYRIRHLP